MTPLNELSAVVPTNLLDGGWQSHWNPWLRLEARFWYVKLRKEESILVSRGMHDAMSE